MTPAEELRTAAARLSDPKATGSWIDYIPDEAAGHIANWMNEVAHLSEKPWARELVTQHYNSPVRALARLINEAEPA